jgi:hypothetical protein
MYTFSGVDRAKPDGGFVRNSTDNLFGALGRAEDPVLDQSVTLAHHPYANLSQGRQFQREPRCWVINI